MEEGSRRPRSWGLENWVHRWPHFLPGGTAALFTLSRTPGNYTSADIGVMDFERNVQKVVLPNAGMAPRYLPTGHLAYVSKGTLYVVPFDLERREVRGDAIPVLEGIAADPVFGAAQIDVSPGGTMVYRSGTTSGLRVLEWLDGAGRTESMGLAPAFYQYPRVSPDGSRVAYELNQGATSDIWVYDWQRGTRTKLTGGSGVNTYPVWSPDGQYVVFHSAGRLFWARADGASPSEPLMASQKSLQFPGSFTPDGKRLAFFEVSPDRWKSHPDRGGRRRRRPDCGSVSPWHIGRRHRTTPIRPSRRMGAGWRTCRPTRADTKSTCAASPIRAGSGPSRRAAASIRCGRAPRTSCSTARRISV